MHRSGCLLGLVGLAALGVAACGSSDPADTGESAGDASGSAGVTVAGSSGASVGSGGAGGGPTTSAGDDAGTAGGHAGSAMGGGGSSSDAGRVLDARPQEQDSGPHSVSPCTALPKAGTWESIAPVSAPANSTTGQNFAEAVVVDPFVAGTVWLSAGYVGIYKSTDCGSSWTNVSKTGNNATAMAAGSFVSLALDPIDRGVMYSVPIYGPGGVWKSINAGVDWTQLFPADAPVGKVIQYNALNDISMDPHDHFHLVVTPHANCSAPYAPACQGESTDGGKTWTFVKLPFLSNWEEGAGAYLLDATSWLYAGNSGLYLTTDRGTSWNNVKPAGVGGLQPGPQGLMHRGSDGSYFLTSLQGLLTSPDGHTWSLAAGCKGRTVSIATGDGHMFLADQWSNTYWTASDVSSPTCSTIPATAAMPSGLGAAFLDYDAAHHVLYSSNLAGGLWRVVTP